MKNGAHVRGDFLDELLQKDCLNDEEKVSVLLDLLLAGYETTSGLMALVVYFLAQAPAALRKLRVKSSPAVVIYLSVSYFIFRIKCSGFVYSGRALGLEGEKEGW